MLVNRFFVKIFFAIFLAKSISAMEDASLHSISNQADLQADQQIDKIPGLREIAFKKVLKILQNDLTLIDGPQWLLNDVPLDIADAIKNELILCNSSAWWYCFGNKAQSLNLDIGFVTHSRFKNNLLVVLGRGAPRRSKFVIFDLLAGEVIVKGSIDKYDRSKRRIGKIEYEYMHEAISKDKSKITEVLYSSLMPSEKKNKVRDRYTSIGFEEDKFEFYVFDLLDYELGDVRKTYQIPLNTTEESILDINKYMMYSSAVYNNDQFILNGSHNIIEENSEDQVFSGQDCRRPERHVFFLPLFRVIKVKLFCKQEMAATGCSIDQNIKIWDLNTLECIRTIKLNYDPRKFKISEDGTLILVRLPDENTALECEQELAKVALFDVDTGKEVQVFSQLFSNNHKVFNLLINEKKTAIGIIASHIKFEDSSEIKIYSIDSILNSLNIGQITLIKLLYDKYKTNNCTQTCPIEISSNSVWNQILKTFDAELQRLIFEKFNLKISCDNL